MVSKGSKKFKKRSCTRFLMSKILISKLGRLGKVITGWEILAKVLS
jgi:hypothetical protein